MYAVSQEFLDQMRAPVRKVLAKVTIDYTDPTQDETIEVTASEQANVSYPTQTADFTAEPAHKWAALDGAWVLDGTWHLAPLPEDAYLYQMGWWSAQVAGEDGRFSEPYPTLILTHPARPVLSYQVVGDVARQEWPTEFVIRLYGPDGSLLRERTVTGNAEIQFYELLDPPALDVTRQELEIRAWSHPGRHAKILEFFTSLQETYEGNDLLEVHLLEESESGNGVGRGGVSTNEITVRLVNRGGRFDVINPQSPFRELLRPNRRVRAWLGVEGAKHLWGEGWYAPFDRDLTLSRQNGAVIEPLPGAVATLRPGEGRFGGAVAVEEGTTNLAAGHDILIYNNDPNQWEMTLTTLSETFMGKPIVRITLKPLTDAARDHVRNTHHSHGCMHSVITFNANTTYTATIYWRCLKPSVQVEGSPSNIPGWGDYRTEEVGSGWKRSYAKWYDTTTRTDRKFWGIRDPLINTGETIVIDFVAPQIEAKPFATSFVDGTRAAGHLRYPATLLNPNAGTVAMWIIPQRDLGPTATIFFEANAGTTNQNQVFIWQEGGVWRAGICAGTESPGAVGGNTPDTWPAGVPIFVALTWKNINSGQANAEIAFYKNGQYLHGRSGVKLDLPQPTILAVGSRATNPAFWANSLIDELLILPYAASEEHIAELYRETRPLYDEWVPLGVFWSTEWDSEELEAMVRARDRMELLRRTTYEPGPLKQNVSLYELAQDVLTHAKMPPETYWLDPGLQDIVVPWGWVPPGSHRDALRVIAEAGMARVYCDRDGVIRIERVATPTGVPVLEITKDDYFPPARNPVTSALVANRVVVTTQPLVPASSPEEVYRATVEVPAGQTITVRAEYNKRPVINAVASLESPPAGVSIVGVTYRAVAAEVQIRNTGASAASVTLVITGRPLSVEGGEQVVEEDDLSIRELGLIVHEVPTNPLVQTSEYARAIAQTILARSAKQRRDVELEWRGNPALEVDDVVSVDGMQAQVVRQELSWAGALSARLVARRLD